MVRVRMPGGPADARAIFGAGRPRRPLRQRHAAHHHAPDHPVPRRRQAAICAPPSPTSIRLLLTTLCELRRRGAQRRRHGGAGCRCGARALHDAATTLSAALLPRTRAHHADLRARRGRRAHPGGGAAVWADLPAAQIQDRPRPSRRQHDRRAVQRSRPDRRVRGRHGHRLDRLHRRRAWHDAQQCAHLSAAGDAGRAGCRTPICSAWSRR